MLLLSLHRTTGCMWNTMQPTTPCWIARTWKRVWNDQLRLYWCVVHLARLGNPSAYRAIQKMIGMQKTPTCRALLHCFSVVTAFWCWRQWFMKISQPKYLVQQKTVWNYTAIITIFTASIIHSEGCKIYTVCVDTPVRAELIMYGSDIINHCNLFKDIYIWSFR